MTANQTVKDALQKMHDEGFSQESDRTEAVRRYFTLIGRDADDPEAKWHWPGVKFGLGRLAEGQPI